MTSNITRFTKIYPILIGKLLGDGCITKQKGRKPRFQFIHTIADKDWCFHCYEALKEDLPLSSPYYKKVKDARLQKGYSECFQVQSQTDPIITWLESIWYDNRRKVIPFHFLEQHINENTLAWWYQDDGHLSQRNNVPKKVILSTENFTKLENQRLIGLLTRKFHLSFRLDAQNRLILYDQVQIYYFLHLVKPFMHSSMDRKKLINPKLCQITNKRTTIYLPVTIQLTKPTSQINEKLINLFPLLEIIQNRPKYINFYKEFILKLSNSIVTKGYQIIINEEYLDVLHFIKNNTGLTISQIVSICFHIHYY